MPENIKLGAMSSDPITGKPSSFAAAINPDNRWKIAAPYKNFDVIDYVGVYPRDNASANASFRFASTEMLYTIVPTWAGLKPPFRLTLVNSPASASIGSSGKEQTYTRTQDADIPTMYIHSLPDNFARVSWQPASGDEGSKKFFRLMIEDQDGQVKFISWSVTVQSSRFMYFDSVYGNDANAGTFASSKQTAAHAYSLTAPDKIFVFKNGTYFVDSDFALGSTKCKSWLALNHRQVNLDLDAGLFSNDGVDACFQGINFVGARTTATNVKNMWWNLATGLKVDNCTFAPDFFGTSGTDNPACIFTTDTGIGGAATPHQYISINNTDLIDGSQMQLLCLFDAVNGSADNCNCTGATLPDSNGSDFIQLKDGCRNISIRHCTVNDWFSHKGAIAVLNQDGANASNQEVIFCAIRSTNISGSTWAVRWNIQAAGVSNMYLTRCTLSTGTQNSIISGDPSGGEPPNVNGILYATTLNLDQGTGSTNVGEPSQKVAANKILSNFSYASDIKAAALGKVGHLIASPLVV